MRLFVAVWPPDDIVAVLAAIPRPAARGVRWSTPDQWHVTLRFLGDVDRPTEATAALERAELPVATAALGPAVARITNEIAAVPVRGLDELATAVIDATRESGAPPPDRPFRGHLTVARSRRRGDVTAVLGAPVVGSWDVSSVHVVRTELHPEGARYETLAVVELH